MKKILFFATAALVALASCSKTEVTDLNGPQEIGFKAIPRAMTKTLVAQGPLQSGSLGVYAQYRTVLHQSDLMPMTGCRKSRQHPCNAPSDDTKFGFTFFDRK